MHKFVNMGIWQKSYYFYVYYFFITTSLSQQNIHNAVNMSAGSSSFARIIVEL